MGMCQDWRAVARGTRARVSRLRFGHAGTDRRERSVMTRQLTIATPDSRLFTVDTPAAVPPDVPAEAAGATPALLFVNGAFATVQSWNRVIERLGGRFRSVRFDARGRGRSGRSADYSVQAAVDDVGRVVAATGLEQPILVGWSHGATLAVRHAARHPDQVRGLVLV